MGAGISPNAILPIGFGLLFFYTGILCGNAKRNWFIGIRTPWTLSSEIVWERTHRIGGKLFKAAGVTAFFGVFFQDHALFFILVPRFWLPFIQLPTLIMNTGRRRDNSGLGIYIREYKASDLIDTGIKTTGCNMSEKK